MTTPVAATVHTVNILSNGGDDQINVQFGTNTFRPLFDATPLTIQIGAGDGNDTAAVTVYGLSENGGSVLMAMGGGLGNDNLSADRKHDAGPGSCRRSRPQPGHARQQPIARRPDHRRHKGDDTLTAQTSITCSLSLHHPDR